MLEIIELTNAKPTHKFPPDGDWLDELNSLLKLIQKFEAFCK